MHAESDKRRIYFLIDAYLSQKIDELTFCDAFHCSYVLELDYDDLTKIEQEVFSELRKVVARFAESEKDLEEYPDLFSSKKELRQKVLETKQRLKKNFEELKEKGNL